MINLSILRIRRYAVLSLLVPFITINFCYLLFFLLGNIQLYPNLDWDKENLNFSTLEYFKILNDKNNFTFTNCPKYEYKLYYTDKNNKIITNQYDISSVYPSINGQDNDEFLLYIKKIQIKLDKNKINNTCTKKYPIVHFLLNNFNLLEKTFVEVHKNNEGFSKIKNPYFYGEVSISRTARYYPAILIFKPFIILSAILLFFYWKNNLILFNSLKKEKIINFFSSKFFYFGVFSCIFLAFHATFLGLDIDSKLFDNIRRAIIILFIFCELVSQILLTVNLYKIREKIKKYISPLVLKIKIIFVSIFLTSTVVSLIYLSFYNPTNSFKNILEWNYFSALLLYYLLSRLLWKKRFIN